jgi:hypothetical protein
MIRAYSTAFAVALLGFVASCPQAHAAFSRSVTASAVTYTSATLQRPASASATCATSGSTTTATVNWTASPSTFLTGYRITSTPASQNLTAAASARTRSFTLAKGNYTFTVVATYRSWTSTARTTTTVTC